MFAVAPLMNDGQKVETIQMSSVYEWIYNRWYIHKGNTIQQ